MSIAGCSGLDTAQQYIVQIQALKASNQRLQRNIKKLNEDLGKTKESLSTAQSEVNELKSRNSALEKMSEERIKKFWSMYDTGS